jgi:hypothetical protein
MTHVARPLASLAARLCATATTIGQPAAGAVVVRRLLAALPDPHVITRAHADFVAMVCGAHGAALHALALPVVERAMYAVGPPPQAILGAATSATVGAAQPQQPQPQPPPAAAHGDAEASAASQGGTGGAAVAGGLTRGRGDTGAAAVQPSPASASDVMRYHYFAGVVFAALGRWAEAADAFATVS